MFGFVRLVCSVIVAVVMVTTLAIRFQNIISRFAEQNTDSVLVVLLYVLRNSCRKIIVCNTGASVIVSLECRPTVSLGRQRGILHPCLTNSYFHIDILSWLSLSVYMYH